MDESEAIFRYHLDSDINQYQGWIPKTIDDAYEFVRTRISSELDIPHSWFQFVIIKRENGKLKGDIGIHFLDSEKNKWNVVIGNKS